MYNIYIKGQKVNKTNSRTVSEAIDTARTLIQVYLKYWELPTAKEELTAMKLNGTYVTIKESAE